ncbi:MAG: hypothetical protein LBQ31_06020 [Bacteroidales bacterium]|nr:hypothetical protein [Bacteroidales bacterium]
MGVPPPLASSWAGSGFHSNLFCHPHEPPATKKDFRSIPNASPPQCPTRADYAERERLHCEAIIPNAQSITNYELRITN